MIIVRIIEIAIPVFCFTLVLSFFYNILKSVGIISDIQGFIKNLFRRRSFTLPNGLKLKVGDTVTLKSYNDYSSENPKIKYFLLYDVPIYLGSSFERKKVVISKIDFDTSKTDCVDGDSPLFSFENRRFKATYSMFIESGIETRNLIIQEGIVYE